MTEEATPPGKRKRPTPDAEDSTLRATRKRRPKRQTVVRIVDDNLDPQGWGRAGKLKATYHPMGRCDALVRRLMPLYPWMFEGPNWGLALPQRWLGVFLQLCAEIDQTLAKDRMGFRWTDLHQENGKACWQFVWGQDYWRRVAVFAQHGKIQIQPFPPEGDPRLALQQQIRQIVNRYIARANSIAHD